MGKSRTREHTLYITERSRAKLKRVCDEHGLSPGAAIEQLCDFYNMQKIDLLINRLRRIYTEGLDPIQAVAASMYQSGNP